MQLCSDKQRRVISRLSTVLLFAVAAILVQAKVASPKPLAPVPTHTQLAWQELEYYAFIHFGMNTFSDHEWGEGREPADDFNPTALDARQWARVVSMRE